MSLTAREIGQVVSSLAPLKGAVVQKVWVPEPRTLYLELRKPGASHLLALCAEPNRSRLHLASARPPSPAVPFALQGYLRQALTGASLQAVEAAPNDRWLLLRFATPDGPAAIAAELTGRHGNLFALAGDGTIRATGVPSTSTQRENRPGRPYTPPLPRDLLPPSEATTRFAEALSMGALSHEIEALYAATDRALALAARRRERIAPIVARITKVERTLEKVRADEERASHADTHRRLGELLKQNLFALEKGQREALLTDYTEEGIQTVRVPLDPALTPQANVEREFHRYRRLRSGQQRARERREELEAALASLFAERERAEAALASSDDADAPPSSARPTAVPPPHRKKQGPRLPYREYLSESGQRIRVGRSAADNDALTFRHARGSDIWLHARGGSGSHVVIPLSGQQLQEATLYDAALLAAHFSEQRDRGQVDIAWTQVKYVRKVKGALGAVTYSQDRTRWCRADPDRLHRLLATVAP